MEPSWVRQIGQILMKNLWIDLETTGLDVKKHGVVQIAGIVEIDGEVAESFNFYTKPLRGDGITKRSMEVNHFDLDTIKGFPEAEGVKYQLLDIFKKYVDPYYKNDKFFLMGYNAKFDYDFLRRWFEKQSFQYFGAYFWFPPVDVMNLGALATLTSRKELPNFKLMSVAKAFGVRLDETLLHDAHYDIKITRELFYKLMETLSDGRDHKQNGRPT